MRSGLIWSGVVSAVVIGWVWFALGGREYYLTPLAVRGYLPTHRLLRPSGPVGQTLGVVGTAMMLMPFLYMARKRIRGLKEVGSLRTWLELHLFCGIVGPLLVTFHTSFKFNGIISAAYWSMVIVVLSGFVGRYLYVRIPRSIRGNEMTRAELDARAEALRESLAETHLSDQMLAQVHQFEQWAVPSATGASLGGLFFGDIAVRTRLRVLDRRLAAAGLDTQLRANVVALTAERATLLRRFAYLQKTKKLFELWHVFHLPLVYLLLVIASAHIAIALYMGYVPFRW